MSIQHNGRLNSWTVSDIINYYSLTMGNAQSVVHNILTLIRISHLEVEWVAKVNEQNWPKH